MNMKKCVYCGQFYDSDRSMTCSNCGQKNPAVPQGNPGVPQGNPAVPQENPSSGPVIAPSPVITPQHEGGESFFGTSQSAAASGACRVSDYRYSGPSRGANLVRAVAYLIVCFGIMLFLLFGWILPLADSGKHKEAMVVLIIGVILPLIEFRIIDLILTKIFNIDLKRRVSFNLFGDNISVYVKEGIIIVRVYLCINGLSREIKAEKAEPFLTQLSMVDPIAYNKIKIRRNFVFDVNGRICRLFNFGEYPFIFIDGIKVVDTGVQVVYELPAKNS